ncbi:MAG: bifunctional alpha,alpha-trehalose-phosphate synthase (UDP-forming)/trehalose-phosphatase [Candidatus Woykebacteria bacterium]
MSKIILVSNRLPIRVKNTKEGFKFAHAAGGLSSGLDSFQKSGNYLWVGWPGAYIISSLEKKARELKKKLISNFNYYPVFQSQKEIENYYGGFCNSTIWPLFHYFSKTATYNKSFWQSYKKVNESFRDAVLENAEAKDTIWVHDYHLMLLPALLREKLPNAKIGFFLHIPFPSFELFRLLPQRVEILKGLLGADVIGFHTYEYARHFLNSVHRLLGLDHSLGQINTGERIVKADAFPLGVDYEKFNNAHKDIKVQTEITKLKRKIGNRKVILSVDRLDYTKGIPQRLEAYSDFLERNPLTHDKVVFILLAAPTRTKVEEYQVIKKQVDELTGRINGKYGNVGWTPIWYLYRTFDFTELAALYSVADVALVTPIRDGMNLIAKEFVATKRDGRGVLILSEMAGAAEELGEALVINPNNKDEIVEALKKGIAMSDEEKISRVRLMQKELAHYTEKWWVKSFLERLEEIRCIQDNLKKKILNKDSRDNLAQNYAKAKKRLLLLDYDGTLVTFAATPEQAKPDKDLLNLLSIMSKDTKNELVIISGRNKETLDEWFGDLPLNLVAEHGAWIKEKNKEWDLVDNISSDWKKEIYPILVRYVDRTPGSFIEEKDFSLAWHYRKVDPGLGMIRCRELSATLNGLTPNFNLQYLEGSKVVEIKSDQINKGRATIGFLGSKKWDFVLALGDDVTDEDIFGQLPGGAYSIKVGLGSSKARFNLKSVRDARALLQNLVI